MHCPACDRALTKLPVSDVVVDACVGGCGGIFFDGGEMQKFDEAHEGGEALLAIARDSSWASPVDAPARSCPVCTDTKMLQHFSSVTRKIEVDECGNCGGYFFDGGELQKLREEFASQADRDAAAQKSFGTAIDGTLSTLRAEGETERAKVRRIARAFRFICPSYYVPGEQSWGAY